MKLLLVDGNYFLHRAFSIAVKNRDPAFIEKNVLTLFVSMIFSEIVLHRATHVAVTFDAPDCWRLDVYPRYKERRRKPKDPIFVNHPKYTEPVEVKTTAGELVKPAKEVLGLAGIKTYHKARLESDDLLASLTARFTPYINIVIDTRDKDMASLVSSTVALYWPVEKKFLGPATVKDYYGVLPFQIRDMLSLTGDKVDDIPGVPGVAAKTASSMLRDDTLKNRLRSSAKLRAKLKPYYTRIALAQKLTTLKVVDIKEDLADLVPRSPDKDALIKRVWSIPKALDSVGDVSKAAKLKGLFRK